MQRSWVAVAGWIRPSAWAGFAAALDAEMLRRHSVG
jgi:hypothetical protein